MQCTLHHDVHITVQAASTHPSHCIQKQLKAIAAELHRLRYLGTLTLTKTYRLADGTMLAAALLLLQNNLALREIHIVWVTTKVWKQSGDYTVIPMKNNAKVPDALEVKEFGPRVLGGSFTRRFRYALEGGDIISKGLAKIRR